MRKLGRAELRPYTMHVLKTVQSMLCPICGNEISLTVMGNKSDYVVDHDHNTGEVRGILHRGCNSAEGKVRAAIQSWGKQNTLIYYGGFIMRKLSRAELRPYTMRVLKTVQSMLCPICGN